MLRQLRAVLMVPEDWEFQGQKLPSRFEESRGRAWCLGIEDKGLQELWGSGCTGQGSLKASPVLGAAWVLLPTNLPEEEQTSIPLGRDPHSRLRVYSLGLDELN